MIEDTRYFPTASNVAIFLNSLHVDLAYRVDWKEASDKVPIYGYNDIHFSRVAQSKSIIQGFLIVNFIFPGYLGAALRLGKTKERAQDNKFNKTKGSYKALPSRRSEDQSFYNSLDEDVLKNPKLYNYTTYLSQSTSELANTLKTELPPNIEGSDKIARAEYIASLVQNPELRNKARQALTNITTIPVTKKQELRERISDTSLLLSNQPENGSVIDLYYSDPTDGSWFSRFENVFFTDVSQQISQAGAEGSSEPLFEIYQFIASNKKTVIKR
jgi:hypothetical protein